MSIDTQTIKKLISRGETKKAIASLKDSDLYQVREDSIVMISARFEELNNDKIQNVISSSEFNLESAKINRAILDLLSGKELQTEKKQKKKMMWIGAGVVFFLLFSALLANYFIDRSKQNQYILILDERANEIFQALDMFKEEISNSTDLSENEKQKLLKSFQYLESEYRLLHEKNREAIKEENYLLSHEITRKIHFLSNSSSLEEINNIKTDIPELFSRFHPGASSKPEATFGFHDILLSNDTLRVYMGMNEWDSLDRVDKGYLEIQKDWETMEKFTDFYTPLSKVLKEYPFEDEKVNN